MLDCRFKFDFLHLLFYKCLCNYHFFTIIIIFLDPQYSVPEGIKYWNIIILLLLLLLFFTHGSKDPGG